MNGLIFPGLVYGLGLVTAVICAVVVLLSWRRTRAPILFWTGISFVLLSINNVILLLDRVILLDVNFWPWRQVPTVFAVLVLLYGFSRRSE